MADFTHRDDEPRTPAAQLFGSSRDVRRAPRRGGGGAVTASATDGPRDNGELFTNYADDRAAVAAEAIEGRAEGAPLPGAIAAQLGAAYGRDMSDVRIHTDARSGAAAEQAGAEAFTYGADVFFAPGRYAPDTEHGSFVLAHELAHVAQQGDVVRARAVGETGEAGDPQEEEASAAAAIALAGGRADVKRAGGKIASSPRTTATRGAAVTRS